MARFYLLLKKSLFLSSVKVQYSRILASKFYNFHYHLFIRDIRRVLYFLFLCISLLIKSADAGISEKKHTLITGGSLSSATSSSSSSLLTYETDVPLQTCCPFQSQWSDDLHGHCESRAAAADDNHQHLEFPGFLTIDVNLVATAFRNMTWDRKFRLRQNTISCPSGTIKIHLNVTSKSDQKPKRPRLNNSTVFAPVGGYLRHNLDVFYPDEFCFNKITDSHLEIIACKPDCFSEETPCIPKCCDIGQVWDLTRFPDGPAKCANSIENQWSPQIFSGVKSKHPLENLRPHVTISHPIFWCEEESTIYTLKQFREERRKPFKILRSGETWYKFDRRKWAPFAPGVHCIDGSFVRDGVGASKNGFSGKYEDTIVWDCGPPLNDPLVVGTSQLYGISMIIAAFFLLMTIIVYVLLWEKQNVHGWTLLAYFISLFFMYLVYSAVHFTSLYLKQDKTYGGGTVCYVIGVLAHFFFLSSFCFMSSVNFDLWWTFRALMPTGGKSKGVRKFLGYVLFSLGIPTIIVGVGITLDHIYVDDPDSDVIVPEYGKKTCYVDREYATLPYLHGPAGVLLSCNLVFFVVTMYTMYKIQQSTKFATMSCSKNAKQKQSFKLFFKILVINGTTWVFEVISQTTQRGVVVPIYFQILDMINIFQAVAIFIIFVLKTDIRNSLENKYPRFRKLMLAITIRPEKANSILRRHPRLRFLINPLTRSITSTRSCSTAKTTLSNGTEGSTSSRRNVLARSISDHGYDHGHDHNHEHDGFESTGSSSAQSSPTGSLSSKGRSEGTGHDRPPEIMELR